MNRYAIRLRDIDSGMRDPRLRHLIVTLAEVETGGVVSAEGLDAAEFLVHGVVALEAIRALFAAGVPVFADSGGPWLRILEAPEVPDLPDEAPELDAEDDPPRIDPEFAGLCGTLADDALEGLRLSLLAHGCRDPLVVWAEADVLLDGHNRLALCQALRLPYRTVEYSFATREAARNWIIDNALARRNLSEQRRRYLRGKRLRSEKKDPLTTLRKGESAPLPHSEGAGETADRIARCEGVSRATIERDAEYAAAIDQLADLGSARIREALLSGDLKLPRTQVLRAAAAAAAASSPEERVTLAKLRELARSSAPPPDLVADTDALAVRLARALDDLVSRGVRPDARSRLATCLSLPQRIDRLDRALADAEVHAHA